MSTLLCKYAKTGAFPTKNRKNICKSRNNVEKNAYICTVNRPATASTYSAPHPTMPQDCPVFQYPSHRPRYKGHDYYERGIYLITIVIAHRDPLLGKLNMDPIHPAVDLTPLGRAVEEEWEKIPDTELLHGRHLRILGKVAMPDHFHGVLFVEERMDVSVGRVIWGFKTACTKRWRAITGVDAPSSQPMMADDTDTTTPTPAGATTPTPADTTLPPAIDTPPTLDSPVSVSQPSLAATPLDPRRMSRAQRARYYASLPREQRPLFDDNYDDSVLFAPNQLEAMLAYVKDNPRRAILKARVPQFMQSCLCLTIGGVRYSAFGNFFLLRKPLKAQVFCHRMARMEQLTLEERLEHGYTALPYPLGTRTKVRYIDTQAWLQDREAWVKAAQNDTVLVTPGISPGELEMKNIAINSRLPLIHLQKEPITKKPEGERFLASAEGSLLILAPWTEDLDAMPRPSLIPLNGGGTKPGQTSLPSKQGERGGPSDYDRFHNMNLLAEQICRMDVTCTNLSFRVIGE